MRQSRNTRWSPYYNVIAITRVMSCHPGNAGLVVSATPTGELNVLLLLPPLILILIVLALTLLLVSHVGTCLFAT